MINLIENPPRTTMEVFKMLPEGTRCELINGIIYMSPAPTTKHQGTVVKLIGQFYNFINKSKIGEVLIGPVDVYLDNKKNAFQPDIVFISTENSSIIKEAGIYGAPDLVIEVLSPGTENFDLTKKKKVYEKSGVKEYWVIDTQTKICTGFQLVNKKFVEFKKEKGKLTSALLRHTFKI
jgi:Uma2 family endonuclease